MKAFLGMGLLGSNFVQAMISRGDEVQVWNRTPSKATALEQYGAKVFADVSDAVRGASFIHLTLKDDASVDEVVQNASTGFAADAVIIDHTTTSKEGAIERTARWKEKGFTYLHAPVFMGPPNALEASGFMLVSGDQTIIKKLNPMLSKMTGQLLNFGEETGKASAIKLIGNSFLVSFTTGIRDTLSLAKALAIPVSDVTTLFNSWNPGAMLPARLKRMTDGDFTHPSWELSMARKDTGLFIEAAEKAGLPLSVIPAAAALMDEWIKKGYGNHDWTVIAKDSV